jgi:N4-gp56 family major capsid protein
MAANWASGLQVSRWAKELQSEVSKGVYFSKFMGEGPGSAIHVKQMEDGKGKDVTFGLVSQLSGSAITGDSSLEGNEQSLSTFSNTVSTNQKRLAVRDTGKFANSKVLYDFRSTALDLLKTQYAELIDADIFSALSKTSGTHAYVQADAANGATYGTSDPKASLVAGDKITLADISALKTIAQIGGSANYRMRPIRVDGNDYYVLVVHPEVAYDLFELDEFQQMQREAQQRGDSNPLFSGALGIYNGVVIHSHEGVNLISDGGGAAVKGARNLFMGAQAACFAESSDMMWVEKTFDYGNQLGISAAKIYGVDISDYNSKDYGVIQYVSARTNL